MNTRDQALQAYSDMYKDNHGVRPRMSMDHLSIAEIDELFLRQAEYVKYALEQEREDADPNSWKKYAHLGLA